MSWPWVAVWQLAFVSPVLWLALQIFQGRRLVRFGSGRDLWLGAVAIATIISMVRSPLGLQSQWQGWIVLASVGAVYALSEPMARSREKLLRFQGYLSLGFIALSLLLWVTQTWQPALQNLAQIKQVTGSISGLISPTLQRATGHPWAIKTTWRAISVWRFPYLWG
ncbi:MAG: hypothetical protein HC860_03165 [Alkalinema sp. RU_4_3]|nr:hypothetical protein [Alkalinema sp. RU_4_3]